MERQYSCQICTKEFANSNSLSNHNRKFHTELRDYNRVKNSDNLYKCRKCENAYKTYQSRWRHEQKCKPKTDTDIQLEHLTEKLEMKDQIISLQNKLLIKKTSEIRTFKSVNKVLMARSKEYMLNKSNNSNSLNTINSHNNITNNITNNIQQICNVGNEDMINILTPEEKIIIMNSRMKALEKLIEITHCGENPQFKNVVITSLKDDFAYKYDSNKGFFITVKKDVVLDDIIYYRTLNIEEIYEELKHGNKINSRTKETIQRFLDKCESDEPFEDPHGIKYPNFKTYKKDSIKILLYNNLEKITRDISQLIESSSSEPSS
jgi:hypothetical protein